MHHTGDEFLKRNRDREEEIRVHSGMTNSANICRSFQKVTERQLRDFNANPSAGRLMAGGRGIVKSRFLRLLHVGAGKLS